MNRKALYLPELPKQNIIAQYAQIRPYRQGGFRIQKQVLQNKFIFHNYGHAGSGISLSYGSAFKVVDLFEAQVKEKKTSCAILGSGIIGLLTALQLINRGYKVKLYSKKFPKFGQKNNNLLITSQIAPGFWFPYDYLDKDGLGLQELASLTMNFLKKAISNNTYKGLKICKVYDKVYSQQIIKKFEPILIQGKKEVQIDFGSGICQNFNQFSTVRIDMQLWLKQIIQQLQIKGAQLINLDLKNIKEVLNLEEKYIFNCTGYGSKSLFNDNKMKAYRGHIIQFKNSLPSVFNFIFGAKLNDQVVRIYCHQSRILLGLSKQQSEEIKVEKSTVDKLLNNYSDYLKKWSVARPKI